MPLSKADIIGKLQKEILSLQGFKPASNVLKNISALGILNNAFPNKCFPLGAVHEFICADKEQLSPTAAFISCLVSKLIENNSPIIWIGLSQKIFPPALIHFGISPERVIFINAKNRKEILWMMEESLKCEGIAAVIAEIKEINFTESRRLQLSVEQSKVTGFVIRNAPLNIGANVFVSRWKILHAVSINEEDIPGVGFCRWNVSLMKIKNGKPGSWLFEWSDGQLKIVRDLIFVPSAEKRKVV